MKYSFLLKTCVLFFCLAIPHHECASEEYFLIGNADSIAKPKPHPYASSHGFYVYSSAGKTLKYGDKLPEGYVWLPDNRLQLPAGVVLEKNGFLTLPNNEYPEQYDIKSDGSVVAPDGFVLKPKAEEKKKPSSSEEKDNPKEQKEEKELSIEELLDFDTIFAEEKAAEEAKAKGKKPTTVAENKEKKATPTPKAKKKGDKFEIPKAAYKDENLSFMEGCWKADGGKICTDGNPIEYSRFCFDKSGRGQRTIYEKNGEFKGSANAIIINNYLYIYSKKLSGKASYNYASRNLYCDGSGTNTLCKQEILCDGKTLIDYLYLKRD